MRVNPSRRRRGAAATLGLAALLFGHAPAGAGDTRLIWLRSVHLGEELRLEPLGRYGVPKLLPWRRLDHAFRSHRTLEERAVNPRLLRTLAQIQRHFGGRRIELLSGYRAPERGDQLSSYHQVGRAADLYIVGVANRDLYDYCRALANLGCGLYPKGTHVHVDVRSRSGTWVDLSRYGESASYVRDAADWVRLHPAAGRTRKPRRLPRLRPSSRFKLNSGPGRGIIIND